MSDGRVRHGHRRLRGRARQHQASADELRRRAEVLFGERVLERRELGNGPPGGEREREPDAGVVDAGEVARFAGAAVGRGGSGGGVGVGVGVRGDGAGATAAWDSGGGGRAGAGGGADGGIGGGAEAGAGAGARAGAEVGAGGGPGGGAWQGRAGLAVRERMPLWLQARCGLERRSVVALTVVLVAAAVLAGQHFWTGRVQPLRAPEVVRAAAPLGSPRPAGGVTAPRSAVGVAGAQIVVDVSGKVREPGVHRLPAGSRVADALRAAGGVRPGTKTDGLNRARFLVDGEQVVVGGAPAVPGAGVGGAAVGGAVGSGGVGTGGSVGGAGAGPAAPVALNTATVEQLDTLPGVGPVLAQHIVDYRTQHGGYRSVDELREVNGIGDRRFADLRNLVRP